MNDQNVDVRVESQTWNAMTHVCVCLYTLAYDTTHGNLKHSTRLYSKS